MMTNCPPSGRGQDHVTRAALSIWWALRTSVSCLLVNAALHVTNFYILEQMNLAISNLVCRLNVKKTTITHLKIPQYGDAENNIYATATAGGVGN